MTRSRRTVALAAFALALAAEVHAGQYVLRTSGWTARQAAALASAGGRVKFSDAAAGIVVAESSNPDFLLAAVRSGAVRSGALDMQLAFVEPFARVDLDPAAARPAAGSVAVPGNDTFYASMQWAPRAIEAPTAWALGYTGLGVRVAVIDGGVYDTHPDLAGNIDTYASRSFVDSGPPGLDGCSAKAYNCEQGTFWHGTHVAGIIAARDNTAGVIGIAPQARIVAVKALHGGFGTFGSVVSAILYAAGQGRANIINMSLGAVVDRNDPGARELIQAMDDAIAFATARGVLVVVSAGNDSINLDENRNLVVIPASSPAAVAVSATGPEYFAGGAANFTRPASYTNFGRNLVWVAGPGGDDAYPGNEDCDIAVAGVGIVTQPCWVFDMVLSTTRAGYSWTAGTSMAAPAVAAVAALARQRNPRSTPLQLKSLLAASATDESAVGAPAYYGRGFVNARRAVTR